MLVRIRTPFYTAIQWRGDNLEAVQTWLGKAFIKHQADNNLLIESGNGRIVLYFGEWMIMDANNIILVFPPATFNAIYEEVRP